MTIILRFFEYLKSQLYINNCDITFITTYMQNNMIDGISLIAFKG